MTLQLLQIGYEDSAWREAFHRYIERVFPSVSFRRWCEYGGWASDYTSFALTDGADIVANASLQRMNIVVEGRQSTGWQLGAVGVIPERRAEGLQRRIISELLQVPRAEDLVFLFANPRVLEFYPRFGFKQVRERFFGVDCEVAPGMNRWARLKLERADHRALLMRLAATALATTRKFGARSYGNVLLWYLDNFYQDCFYYSDDEDVIVVAEQEGDLLRILDVLTAHPIELAKYLPKLIAAPVCRIEFGFTPDLFWPEAAALQEVVESPLFVRGGTALPDGVFKYPVMAQT